MTKKAKVSPADAVAAYEQARRAHKAAMEKSRALWVHATTNYGVDRAKWPKQLRGEEDQLDRVSRRKQDAMRAAALRIPRVTARKELIKAKKEHDKAIAERQRLNDELYKKYGSMEKWPRREHQRYMGVSDVAHEWFIVTEDYRKSGRPLDREGLIDAIEDRAQKFVGVKSSKQKEVYRKQLSKLLAKLKKTDIDTYESIVSSLANNDIDVKSKPKKDLPTIISTIDYYFDLSQRLSGAAAEKALKKYHKALDELKELDPDMHEEVMMNLQFVQGLIRKEAAQSAAAQSPEIKVWLSKKN